MRVLISFVTTSDPWVKETDGPAQTVTAALALVPGALHLLYSDGTVTNFERTRAYLQDKLPSVCIEGHKLTLPDVTDYNALKKLLPETLKSIRKRRVGDHFYLVSGLPQARFIFSLCLTAQVVDGVLLEIQRPDAKDPWPKDVSGYKKRIEELDLEFFSYFRKLFLEQYKAMRLRLDLHTAEISLDNNAFDIRKRRSADGADTYRAFRLMVLIVSKKLYGSDCKISKALISKYVYGDTGSPDVNIPRSINKLNAQALVLVGRKKIPLNPLIMKDSKGNYWLTDQLQPVDETIEISGDLKEYLLKEMKIIDIASYFPFLT